MTWTTVWSHAHRGFASYGKTSGMVSLRFRRFPLLKRIRLVFYNEYGSQPLIIRELTCQTKLLASEVSILPGEIYRTGSFFLDEHTPHLELNFSVEEAVSGFGFADSDFIGRTDKNSTINFCPGLFAVEAELDEGQCIIALGDSLTEGATWVAPLQQKLRSEGVFLVNQGINGSQLLQASSDRKTQDQRKYFYGFAGMTRLQHCLASHQGVKKIIFSLGINDLLSESITLKALQQQMERVAALCEQNQVQLFVCGITPFAENEKASQQNLTLRKEFNLWLQQRFQTSFWDFSSIVGENEQLLSVFDSGDHLHFNAAGGLAISRSIDLELLKGN